MEPLSTVALSTRDGVCVHGPSRCWPILKFSVPVALLPGAGQNEEGEGGEGRIEASLRQRVGAMNTDSAERGAVKECGCPLRLSPPEIARSMVTQSKVPV